MFVSEIMHEQDTRWYWAERADMHLENKNSGKVKEPCDETLEDNEQR